MAILPRQLLQTYMPSREPSRRAFIKRSLAASAGLLLSLGQTTRARARRGHIVVVGAGLAGLACAFELTQAGFSAEVLEARRRVGGRVHSCLLKHGKRQVAVDLGGELIGLQHAAWGAYADRFKLKLVTADEPGDASRVVIDGRLLSPEEVLELSREVISTCRAMSSQAKGTAPSTPWTRSDATVMDALNTGTYLRSRGLSPPALAHMRAFFSGLCGVSVDRQSHLAHLAAVAGGGFDAYWTDSERLRCADGSDALAQALAHALGSSRVLLGNPAVAVHCEQGSAQVTCADGQTFEGDAVVLAIPPSVWHTLTFAPALPATLAPQMGDAVKHIVVPDTPFWEDTPTSLSDGAISSTWTSASGEALICFSGGAEATTATRNVATRAAVYGQALRQRFPHYNAAAAATTAHLDWLQQPYTQGGYSCPAPGEVTRFGPTLHQAHHGLHIAGEHTWYPFWGYMEGALQSGAAVARRLAA